MISQEVNVRKYEFQESDEAPYLFFYRPKSTNTPFKSITSIKVGAAQSRGKGRKFRSWIEHDKQLTRKIEQLEREIEVAKRDFKESFGIEVEEAPAEIERIREEIREKEHDYNIRSAKMAENEELIETMALEYKTELLLLELNPDKEEIYRLLEEKKELIRNSYDKQLFDQTYRRLTTITDEDFKKIIAKLPVEQAQPLIKARKTKKKYDL